MSMLFEWDEVKAKSNSRKHRVSFEEAMTVFLDDLSITVSDPEHSSAESRFRIVGESRIKPNTRRKLYRRGTKAPLVQRPESDAIRNQSV